MEDSDGFGGYPPTPLPEVLWMRDDDGQLRPLFNFEDLPEGAWLTDDDGILRQANPEEEREWGFVGGPRPWETYDRCRREQQTPN